MRGGARCVWRSERQAGGAPTYDSICLAAGDAAAFGSVRNQGRQGNLMARASTVNTIDDYIAGFPPDTRKALQEVRGLIRGLAPEASETISYAMPTFDLNGRHLVHFAGFAKHVGFYPIPSGIEAFKDELAAYKQGRGSVQFPLDKPMPMDLIRRIVEFRVEENRARTAR